MQEIPNNNNYTDHLHIDFWESNELTSDDDDNELISDEDSQNLMNTSDNENNYNTALSLNEFELGYECDNEGNDNNEDIRSKSLFKQPINR